MDFSVFTETDGSKTCMITQVQIPPPCEVQTGPELELTPAEVLACRCELLAYTTALNEVAGISVEVQGGPPYECFDVDCRQVVPSPIPTFNQWGLIALAVVLGIVGIVGFMVIRRKKVTT